MMIDLPNGRNARARKLWFGLAVALSLSGWTLGFGAKNSEKELDKLFTQKRYFELRRILGPDKGDSRPEILFLRGMLANAFNQLDASIGYLKSYLKTAGPNPPEWRLREALSSLSDDYVKSFQYGKAAETREAMTPLIRAGSSPKALADFMSITDLWKAVQAFPPQSVAVLGDTEICPAGGRAVPVDFAGGQVPLIPDTGSGLSLIIRADAKRLGLSLLDVPVQVSTATGERVVAWPTVVGEMKVGRVIVRHAVFLVVPERMLYFPEVKKQQSGTLGFPILAAMKELNFDMTGCIRVPARPRLSGTPNFFLEGESPVLEAKYHGQELEFMLDTGAGTTQLYPRFFRAFRDEVLALGIPAIEEVEGVGTTIKTPAYLMRGLKFRVAGRNVVFNGTIPVMPEPTGAASSIFDGVFGLDILTHFRTMTINYKTMRISLD
jgi:hypothetical protein